MSPPKDERGTTPGRVSPLMNDAASKRQVLAQRPTDAVAERARMAEEDEQYVRRAFRRAADPEIRRLRRQLRGAA